MADGDASMPIPRNTSSGADPSMLTSASILHEISTLKELLYARMDALEKASIAFAETLTRVPTEVDRRTGSLQALIDEKFRTYEAMLGVIQEKFAGISVQFDERDQRVRDSRASDAAALSAALQAAKEAVGEANKSFSLSIDKSEKATSEQIKQQGILLESSTRTLNDKIDDVKGSLAEGRVALGDTAANLRSERSREIAAHIDPLLERVRLLESSQQRIGGRDHGTQASWAYLLGGVGLIGALIAIAAEFGKGGV